MLKGDGNPVGPLRSHRFLSVLIVMVLLFLLSWWPGIGSLLQKSSITRRAVELSLPVEQPVTRIQPGVMAPEFVLPSAHGGTVALRSLAGQRLLIVFVNPECSYCQVVLESLPQVCLSASIATLVITPSPSPLKREEYPCLHLLVGSNEIFHRYKVVSVPLVYLLDEKQRVVASISDFRGQRASELVDELTRFIRERGRAYGSS